MEKLTQLSDEELQEEISLAEQFDDFEYGNILLNELERRKSMPSAMDQKIAAGENILNVASSGAAKIAGGLAGIPYQIAESAEITPEGSTVGTMQEFQDQLTYEPKYNPELSQQQMQSFGQAVQSIPGVQTVMKGAEAYTEGQDLIAGEVGEATGSPAIAAGMYTAATAAPEAIMALLGLKGTQQGAKLAKEGGEQLYKATDNMIKTLTNEPEIKVFDDSGSMFFTEEAIDAVQKARAERIAKKPGLAEQIAEKAAKKDADIFELEKWVNEQIGLPEILTPTEMKRLDPFGRRGVTPLRPNITETIDDWREFQEITKYSNEASKKLAIQDQQMFEAAAQGLESIGKVSTDAVETSQGVRDTIVSFADDLDNAVSDAYDLAKKALPEEKVVTLDTFFKALDEVKGEESFSGGLISAVKGHLNNIGLTKKGEPIWESKLTPEMTEQRGYKKLSVAQAERLRQFLNKKYPDATPAGKAIIKQLKDSIDADVDGAVGQDLFAEARQKKIDFHEAVERGQLDRWDQRKGSLVEDILYNKIDEKDLVQKISRARPDDLEHLKEFLLSKGGDKGVETWQNIKGQILEDAIENAKVGKQEGGGFRFSGNKFKSSLSPILNNRKKDILFNKDEQLLIQDLIEIDRSRMPNSKVQQGYGPSSVSVSVAANALNRLGPLGQAATGAGRGAHALYKNLKERAKIKKQLQFVKPTERMIREEARQ